MQVSPCLKPIRIFNETLGTFITVPCGHCDACLCSRGFSRKQSLSSDIEDYKCKFLVTLTYDDYHLPLAVYDGFESIVHSVDCDYNGVMKSFPLVDCIESDLEYYAACFDRFGGIPVLSHRDMINFRKRLRYYLKSFCKRLNLDYEPYYVYTCGEYGPTTYRPHYHILFGLRNESMSSVLEECVRLSWQGEERNNSSSSALRCPFGEIDFQRCINGKASSYVAQYLNCTSQLPHILRASCYRPFSQKSSVLDRRMFVNSWPTCSEFIRELPTSLPVKAVGKSDFEFCDVPQFIKNRYVPKFTGFGKVPFWCRYRLYSLYDRHCLSATKFVELVHSAFVESACLDSDLFLLKKLVYDSEDFEKTENALFRFYYVSRRVCLNARSVGMSVYDYALCINEFYDKLELLKLRRFYELQQSLVDDVFNSVRPLDLFSLYYETSDNIKNLFYYYDLFGVTDTVQPLKLDKFPSFNAYKSITRKIVCDTTKTKKRNSYFVSRGWKRPQFIPIVKQKFLRF